VSDSRGLAVRLSVILLCCALAGFLGGAALIGLAVLGGALMFVSLAAGVWAILRDDGEAAPVMHEVPSLQSVLERARRAA
jgi:hypothetical protein